MKTIEEILQVANEIVERSKAPVRSAVYYNVKCWINGIEVEFKRLTVVRKEVGGKFYTYRIGKAKEKP